MAGMLPGVEFARRRRIHQGGSSERSPFCLHQRSSLSKELHDCTLGSIAREAKERLDEKLRSQTREPEIKSMESIGDKKKGGGCLQREVYSSKKSMRRFSWSKLGWKAAEQVECAVCLEDFKTGDILLHLTCSHRFHWSCAAPWIKTSSNCPICRTYCTYV
ncbi:uncharacterized protein [Typha angustifolia]|uniref:uncharacterized protein n=1 Tax=Typha angustifolia TaxID=59011 RepID=UPI003C2DA855